MNRVYLTQEDCSKIESAIKKKMMTQAEVAKLVNKSPAAMCRICAGKTRLIEMETAQKLEIALGIYLYNALDEPDVLLKEIEQLRAENEILKQLLIEKWSK